jgi:hypothetical protein
MPGNSTAWPNLTVILRFLSFAQARLAAKSLLSSLFCGQFAFQKRAFRSGRMGRAARLRLRRFTQFTLRSARERSQGAIAIAWRGSYSMTFTAPGKIIIAVNPKPSAFGSPSIRTPFARNSAMVARISSHMNES